MYGTTVTFCIYAYSNLVNCKFTLVSEYCTQDRRLREKSDSGSMQDQKLALGQNDNDSTLLTSGGLKQNLNSTLCSLVPRPFPTGYNAKSYDDCQLKCASLSSQL